FAGDRVIAGDMRSLRDGMEFALDNQETNGRPATALIDSSGQRLYLGYTNGHIRALDINNRREVATLAGHKRHVTLLALSRDGQRLASAATDRTVQVQDANTGQLITTLSAEDGLDCLCLSRDGLLLAGGSYLQNILVWDLRTGAQRSRMTGHKTHIA